jgi:hypothetical protein
VFATQRPLTLEELNSVLAPLGTPVAAEPLGGGTFSAVQLVSLDDGRRLAIKTSVPDHEDRPPLLTYEWDLLRTERDLLRELRDDPAVPVPDLLLDDFTREHVPVDVIATEFLTSTPWSDLQETLPGEANTNVGHSVGRIFAALHARTSPSFGYPAKDFALGAPTWPEAFHAMLSAALDDADTWGVDVRADDVRRVLDRGEAALSEVESPALVHLDLWAGNVLLDPASASITAILDWERAAYADPLIDFVGSESTIQGPTNPNLHAGYLAAGGTLPLDPAAGTLSGLTRAADARTTLYRLYTVTVQQVEVIPRNFTGDWVPGHVAHLRSARDQLLDYALATLPAA